MKILKLLFKGLAITTIPSAAGATVVLLTIDKNENKDKVVPPKGFEDYRKSLSAFMEKHKDNIEIKGKDIILKGEVKNGKEELLIPEGITKLENVKVDSNKLFGQMPNSIKSIDSATQTYLKSLNGYYDEWTFLDANNNITGGSMVVVKTRFNEYETILSDFENTYKNNIKVENQEITLHDIVQISGTKLSIPDGVTRLENFSVDDVSKFVPKIPQTVKEIDSTTQANLKAMVGSFTRWSLTDNYGDIIAGSRIVEKSRFDEYETLLDNFIKTHPNNIKKEGKEIILYGEIESVYNNKIIIPEGITKLEGFSVKAETIENNLFLKSIPYTVKEVDFASEVSMKELAGPFTEWANLKNGKITGGSSMSNKIINYNSLEDWNKSFVGVIKNVRLPREFRLPPGIRTIRGKFENVIMNVNFNLPISLGTEVWEEELEGLIIPDGYGWMHEENHNGRKAVYPGRSVLSNEVAIHEFNITYHNGSQNPIRPDGKGWSLFPSKYMINGAKTEIVPGLVIPDSVVQIYGAFDEITLVPDGFKLPDKFAWVGGHAFCKIDYSKGHWVAKDGVTTLNPIPDVFKSVDVSIYAGATWKAN